jgi:hypothetical protein
MEAAHSSASIREECMYMLASVAQQSVGMTLTLVAFGIVVLGVLGLFVWFLLTDPDKKDEK